jgi:hypothetical protein
MIFVHDDLAAAQAKVPAGKRVYVSFKVDCAVTEPYVWLWCPRPRTIVGPDGWGDARGLRAYGGAGEKPWTVAKGHQYAFYTDRALRLRADNRPENVDRGVARIVGKKSHLWASDPRTAASSVGRAGLRTAG